MFLSAHKIKRKDSLMENGGKKFLFLKDLVEMYGGEAVQEILTAMIQISGLSPFVLKELDITKSEKTAILFLPGANGHEYREKQSLFLWKRADAGDYFLFAGRNEEPLRTREYVRSITPSIWCDEDLFLEQKAQHTPDQTEWALDTLQEQLPDVSRIVVSTAAYHTPRAFLTLLRSMEKRGLERKIILSTLPVYNPDDPAVDFIGFKETGGTGIAGEVERILKYQKPPYEQVATIPSYLSYLKWRLSL